MLQSILLGIQLVILIWLIVLSFFQWQTWEHYNRLTKGAANKNLKDILEVILKELEINKNTLVKLQNKYDTMELESQFHVQKVGLSRFNPFKDTGGEQSFILSLVDGKNSGVIISGLYSRSGTRWYAKRIHEGKGVDVELSDEEKKALKEAAFQNSKNYEHKDIT